MIPIYEIADQMRLESFDGKGIAIVMQPTGEIITASELYDSTVNKNFWTELEESEFLDGSTLDKCKQTIKRGEKLFVEYKRNEEDFYALFQPIGNEGNNDWYLVVRVSAQVISEQTRVLILRSIPYFCFIGVVILVVVIFVYHTINVAQVAKISEKTKSTFLANMSHEIRTPLNGIVGLQYLMRQNLNNTEKLEKYLSKAEVSANFLKGVITDVLDMSKIESGQMEIYEQEMDISRLIDEIKMLLEIQAEEKGVHFYVYRQKLRYPYVLGDDLRIKQILTNLLGNALKFTPKGNEFSLTVSQELTDNVANTTFIVADTGCGMSQEFLKRIWSPFEQEQQVASQNGTGLGTTLSKILAEKMGGTITVESQLGEGSIFTVCVPLKLAEEPVISNESEESTDEWKLNGKRILIAEDNEINRMIVKTILEEKGCEVTETADGEKAISAFEQSSPYYFDLILMDVQMPIVNGYEATYQIRALTRPDGKNTPIFAMTANAFREDIDKAIASGMDDVVTKPLDIPLLLEKMRNMKPRR